MLKNLRQFGAICVVATIIGCGGVEELPPATEAPPPPSEEEMKRIMEESKSKGGMQMELPKPDGG